MMEMSLDTAVPWMASIAYGQTKFQRPISLKMFNVPDV